MRLLFLLLVSQVMLACGGAGIAGPAGAAVQTAFVDAMNTSLRIGSIVALTGALVAWLLIAERPDQPQEQELLSEDAAPATLAEAVVA